MGTLGVSDLDKLIDSRLNTEQLLSIIKEQHGGSIAFNNTK